MISSLETERSAASAAGTTSAVNAIARVSSSLPEAEDTSLRVAALVLCTGRPHFAFACCNVLLTKTIRQPSTPEDALSGYPVDKGTLEALSNICAPLSRPSSMGSSEGMAAMLGFLGALLDGIDGLKCVNMADYPACRQFIWSSFG